jgi:16S rRNA processing protein RimM
VRKGAKAGARVAAGRIAKTFGSAGELVVSLYDTFPDETRGESVSIEIDGIWTPFYFASFRRRGQSKAVVVFEDLETEYRASELVGREFFLPAGEAGERGADDEPYLDDLLGYTVRSTGQPGTGTVTGLVEHELNPLFEVAWNGRQILIPAADELIVSVDPSRRSIVLDIPDGLLDL